MLSLNPVLYRRITNGCAYLSAEGEASGESSSGGGNAGRFYKWHRGGLGAAA